MKQLTTAIVAFFCSFSMVSLAARGNELSLTETDDTIRITLRDKPVLEYVKTARPVPEGVEKHFSRSGYIHPVYAPTGQEISGDYPLDHAHQHALFFAWTKSSFDGKKIDFWNQAEQLAGIEFREVVNVKREQKQVSFSAKHAFTVGTGDERVDALHEIWTVTVHLTTDDHFLFDIESVQQCASDKPLILEEYHYGGMAFRGNSKWLREKDDHSINPGDLQFLTSDGKNRRDGNHTRPNWVALSGRLDGQDVSLAVFGSPKNFRAPQHVRLHPDKPYFCFAPAVAGKFRIEPGQKYVSRYRCLVTSEAADRELIDAHWHQYAENNK
ncbi:MAG: PmoA family protein [Planctomycetaceae bacterium]|nr:PmoA family protein [Planctomycetaceae bacterium]